MSSWATVPAANSSMCVRTESRNAASAALSAPSALPVKMLRSRRSPNSLPLGAWRSTTPSVNATNRSPGRSCSEPRRMSSFSMRSPSGLPLAAMIVLLSRRRSASMCITYGKFCPALAYWMVPDAGSNTATNAVMSSDDSPTLRIAASIARRICSGDSSRSSTSASASTAPRAVPATIAECTPWPVASPITTSSRPPVRLR